MKRKLPTCHGTLVSVKRKTLIIKRCCCHLATNLCTNIQAMLAVRHHNTNRAKASVKKRCHTRFSHTRVNLDPEGVNQKSLITLFQELYICKDFIVSKLLLRSFQKHEISMLGMNFLHYKSYQIFLKWGFVDRIWQT